MILSKSFDKENLYTALHLYNLQFLCNRLYFSNMKNPIKL